MKKGPYDFSGWASRNDLKCADGRIIRKDAFKDDDGRTVPLVWNHRHDDSSQVLGHARLENRDEGLYAYCSFNDTKKGKDAKLLVQHGDIDALSICANSLKQQGPNVLHGVIREVSLVLAGANPGAHIMDVLQHGEEGEDEAVIFTGEPLELYHSDESSGQKEEDNKTVEDVINSLTEEQKTVVYALIGKALEQGKQNDESEGGDDDVKHNAFEGNGMQTNETILTHADQMEIISAAKEHNLRFQTALKAYLSEHGDDDTLEHGIENVETLFPEYKDVRPGAPEILTTDQGWISKVLAKVHKSPMTRIRTRQLDARDISKLRAQGYKKGTEKKYVGNLKLLSRTTDPTTVYVKSKLDRDDILDITDFDYVAYMYGIDRMNLNEELATAIMIGDGREDGDEGKIASDKIRPIYGDDELFTIYADVDVEKMKTELQGTNTGANFGENFVYAEAVIQSLLYAREEYKGSANPDFYCTPHLVNRMLLARDMNGRRIYNTVEDLRLALNVREIITAEQFAGKERTDKDRKKHKLLGIMCNLGDYYLGANKGGEITHFTDFDIDFNQEKSLLETRLSGANTRVKSVIALEEPAGE